MGNKKKLLLARYRQLFGEKPVPESDLKNLEKKLDIKLSKDFFDINTQCSYEFFGGEIYNTLLEDLYSVIGATKNMRINHNLPTRSIVLGQDAVTMTIMETSEDGSNEQVYIMALEDVERYCEGEQLKYEYQYFPAFLDFYEYLLDEEEKMRAEEDRSE